MPVFAVDGGLLLQVVWVSLVAGIGVTILFSLVVFGTSRAMEARREGENPAPYGALAVLMMVAFLGTVAFGIAVILDK